MQSCQKIQNNRVLAFPKSDVSEDPIITLEQAKQWLKMDGITEDDDTIQFLIDSSIDWAERVTGTSIRTCTITAVVEIHNRIELPGGPVQQIVSINDVPYADVPVNSIIGAPVGWPRLAGYGVYTVVYRAGYSPVPPNLLLSLRSYIAWCYEHRGDSYQESDADFAPAARSQIAQFRRNIGV